MMGFAALNPSYNRTQSLPAEFLLRLVLPARRVESLDVLRVLEVRLLLVDVEPHVAHRKLEVVGAISGLGNETVHEDDAVGILLDPFEGLQAQRLLPGQ